MCCRRRHESSGARSGGKSFRDLFVDAALAAIKNAGVDHLDSLYVGCMTGGLFVGQEHIGSLMADYLGMRGLPATRVESACASGGMAFRSGVYRSRFGHVGYRPGLGRREDDRLFRR